MAHSKKSNEYVLSLGGSIVVPGKINTDFLKEFVEVITDHAKKGSKFAITVGGGKTCRDYLEAASAVCRPTETELSWLGIASTALNALLVRTAFGNAAHPKILQNPTIREPHRERIIILAGWKPGWSTDYVAAVYAARNKIKTIINLTNVSHVYTKDPKKHKDAKPIAEVTWGGYRKIIGGKWKAGMNLPFDPIASSYCEKRGTRLVTVNGRDTKNLNELLLGKPYKGTLIH